MSFNNTQILTEEIPRIASLAFSKLHKDYLTVSLIRTSISAFIIILAVLIPMMINFQELYPWLRVSAIVIVILLVGIMIWHTFRLFEYKQYALRTHDIVYRDGFIWRTITAVPFNRIQHVEVQQGPIERLFNLAKLNIYTAGGSASDLSISGLHVEVAQSLREFISHYHFDDESE